MRSRKEIIAKINELHSRLKGWNVVCNTLMWVLEEHKDPKSWKRWQIEGHMQEGAVEMNERLLRVIDLVGRGRKVLDVGVHNGLLTNKLALTNEVVGLDFPEIVERFKDKYEGFSAVGCDLNKKWPVLRSSFDVVVMGDVLEHFAKPQQLVRRARGALKDQGIMVLSSPWKEPFYKDPLHCNFVDEEFINRVIAPWFDVQSAVVLQMPGGAAVLVVGKRRKMKVGA